MFHAQHQRKLYTLKIEEQSQNSKSESTENKTFRSILLKIKEEVTEQISQRHH